VPIPVSPVLAETETLSTVTHMHTSNTFYYALGHDQSTSVYCIRKIYGSQKFMNMECVRVEQNRDKSINKKKMHTAYLVHYKTTLFFIFRYNWRF
jgi:hypothetical protein